LRRAQGLLDPRGQGGEGRVLEQLAQRHFNLPGLADARHQLRG
jgi:hypothetical protein